MNLASSEFEGRLSLREERAQDALALARVVQSAFGPGRFAKTAERVRETARLARQLSQVAFHCGDVIGCCRIWEVEAAGAPLYFLGPLAVTPQHQGDGVGAALVSASLALCDQVPRSIILIGAPEYFAPFGFRPLPWGGLLWPGPVDAGRCLWRPANAGSPPPAGLLI